MTTFHYFFFSYFWITYSTIKRYLLIFAPFPPLFRIFVQIFHYVPKYKKVILMNEI